MSIKSIAGACLLLVAALGFCSVASAQATRTWVSGVGDDANPCSRTAPCKTFAGAISKTAAGGEISVLDPGGFGAVTITKSMTIDGNGVVASILASGTHGVIVNGAGINVILRNLQINGATTGVDGIRFLNGKSLVVDNVTIQQFNTGASNGIHFAPNSGAATLSVNDSLVTQSGGTSGYGILIRPTATGSAKATLSGVTATSNRVAFRAESNAVANEVNATVVRSVFDSNSNSGIQAETVGTGRAMVTLDYVTANNNGNNGVKADGTANAMVVMSNTSVFGNSVGLAPAGSGQIVSFGNNRVAGNTSDGAATGTLSQE